MVAHSSDAQFVFHQTACHQHAGMRASRYCATCRLFSCPQCKSPCSSPSQQENNKDSSHDHTTQSSHHKIMSVAQVQNILLKFLIGQYERVSVHVRSVFQTMGPVNSDKFRWELELLSVLHRATEYLLRLVSDRHLEKMWVHVPHIERYVTLLTNGGSGRVSPASDKEKASLLNTAPGIISEAIVEAKQDDPKCSQIDSLMARALSNSVLKSRPISPNQENVQFVEHSEESNEGQDAGKCFGEFKLNLADAKQTARTTQQQHFTMDAGTVVHRESIANAVGKFSNRAGQCSAGQQSFAASTIVRNKMVYKYKFGDFGTEISNFTEPSGIASDRGDNLYIADTNNHRVQVFGTDGVYRMTIGGEGELLYPNRVAVDHTNGNIVVTERSPSHQVQIFDSRGRFVRRFGSKVIQHPRGLAVDHKSRIVVIECKVMRVVIFSAEGDVLHKFNCNKIFQFPNNVAVNRQEEIFISDNRLHKIQVFAYNGSLLRSLGHEFLINYPIGVEIDARDRLVVADNHNNFNVTLLDSQTGQVLGAFESRTKHAQCYDITLSQNGELFMSSKDFRIYKYQFDDNEESGVSSSSGSGREECSGGGAIDNVSKSSSDSLVDKSPHCNEIVLTPSSIGPLRRSTPPQHSFQESGAPLLHNNALPAARPIKAFESATLVDCTTQRNRSSRSLENGHLAHQRSSSISRRC